MKKLISVILALSLSTCFFASCKKDEGKDDTGVVSDIVADEETPELTPEMLAAMQPQEVQIKNICQLATMEVYFHNVAKAVKPADTGILGFNQVDRRFWVEYSGTATVGIDMNRYLAFVDVGTGIIRTDMSLGNGFQPYGLPYAGYRGVPDSA